MLRDIIKNRYSARTFLDIEIEQDKINYILDCATHAPSKQCHYPYYISVLKDSEKSKNIKEWLYWQNTWCVDKIRANPTEINSERKRFNGQYKAPLVLVWSRDKEFDKDNALADIMVSASFAMLAAEEQGLATCFGRCHDDKQLSIKLETQHPSKIALGIGYAETNDLADELWFPVIKDKKVQGFEHENVSQNYPLDKHLSRQQKPSKEIVRFI